MSGAALGSFSVVPVGFNCHSVLMCTFSPTASIYSSSISEDVAPAEPDDDTENYRNKTSKKNSIYV